MNYMGGKFRQSKAILEQVLKVLADNPYVEPFCGAMGVASKVCPHAKNEVVLADVFEPVIRMWQYVIDSGCDPDALPDFVLPEDYESMKNSKDSSHPLYAYVAIGCSFGGKYWGGYAREKRGDKGANYLRSSRLKKSTLLKARGVSKADDIRLVACSYDELDVPPRSVIYCDPPYRGKTKPYGSKQFDHDAFWGWCRDMVNQGHVLLITEFSHPSDFVPIYVFGDTTVRHHATKGDIGSNNEVLVCHESQEHLFKEIGHE